MNSDLRYAWRVLWNNPGLTAVAVVSLALGIGANTTIFTLLNAIFLQPLPVAEPARLVSVYTTDSKTQSALPLTFLPVSRLNYEDYRDHNDVFSGLAAFGPAGLSWTGPAEPERLGGQIVTENYFQVLGVNAALGRVFTAQETQQPVVVLGHGLWKRRFGQDPGVIGRALSLNNTSFTVIGVAPETFKGTNALRAPDFWVPMSMYRAVLAGNFRQFYDSRRALLFQVVGRLKPGVELRQAEAAVKTIAQRLEQEYPRDNEKRRATLVSLIESTINPNQRADFLRAGAVLMTVVGLVLLIACANLANLLLARAATREREIAIRVSLGAGRARLLRQMLTESLLLALAGGAAGLLVALWGRHLLWSFRPPFLPPNAVELSLDARVLGFTLGLSLATGLLFGLLPALRAAGDRGSWIVGGRVTRRAAGGALVAAETALAVIALAGAGLFLRSLRNAQKIDPGFETEKLLLVGYNLGLQGYDAARAQEFHRQALERVQAIPGVKAVAVASNPPLAGGFMRTVFVEGQETGPGGAGTLTMTNVVSPRFFETLGIPLLRGGVFSDLDRENTPRLAVINETMARRYWPGEEAIGRRFRFFGSDERIEVSGVVRDAKYVALGEKPQPFVYLSPWQGAGDGVTLHVRTAGDPQALLGSVRSQVQSLDRNLPLGNVTTVVDVMNQSLWAPRMGAGLLGIFGLLALLLAAVGIYGVMSYAVSRRRQEISIRMALGAQAGHVLGMVLRQGMAPVAAGAVIGLVVSLVAAKAAANLLFGMSTADPATFAGAATVLALVALAAGYLPARRATRVDPVIALKYE